MATSDDSNEMVSNSTSTNFAEAHSERTLPIILIPGFKDDERKLATMAAYLQKLGHTLYMFAPQPSHGHVGIDLLAGQFAETIEATYAPGEQVDLFGFSMGGLIGRYYIQRLEGAARIRRFVTLATPHNGTWMAYLYPTRPACIQMRPNSPFLNDLNADLSAMEAVDVISLWSPLDLTIQPPSSSVLPIGKTERVISPAHGLLPYDPIVIRRVASCFGNTGRNSTGKETRSGADRF